MKTRSIVSEIAGGQSIDFNFDTTTFEILEPAYEFYEPKIEELSDKEVENEILQSYEIDYNNMEE